MYVLGLGLRWLSSLAAAKASVSLHLYRAFVCPYHVVEGITEIFLYPLETLHFILLANQLAIDTASGRPAQSSATPEDCPHLPAIIFVGRSEKGLLSM